MLPDIPILGDYGISSQYGFLPAELPLERLPDPYYNRWEYIVSNLPGLILSKRLRQVIDTTPVLSTAGLEHDSEWRRAYSMLCFMAHGYIWGGDSPSEHLPAAISTPLLIISEHLEVPPVATYAAVCLWNFKQLFVDEDLDDLENIATLTTFTGSIDESWFYLVSVAIEARGGPLIPLMLTAIQAARNKDEVTVGRCLLEFAKGLDDLDSILQRMHENCDPHVFYHRLRPFLAGSKNMVDAGLPNGVIYEDGSGTERYRQYSGGSNAQSSLLQFFDIVLGVEHRPTGERKDMTSESELEGIAPPPKHNFLHDMRKYMPGPHRRFLEDVTMVANIHDFVDARPNDEQLTMAYDACVAMLSAFRGTHMKIVSRYIVIKSTEKRPRSPEVTRRKTNLSTASTASTASSTGNGEVTKKTLKGTGGTALMSFLKQARDETGDSAIGSWARQMMHQEPSTKKQGRFLQESFDGAADGAMEVCGLAGTWKVDDNAGGLCHY